MRPAAPMSQPSRIVFLDNAILRPYLNLFTRRMFETGGMRENGMDVFMVSRRQSRKRAAARPNGQAL
jgi:hypothetical protein